jgi:hypothetical protein
MSNLINTIQQTMSSFEISNLTGKRHADVMRDIRELNKAYDNLYERKIALKHRISDLGGGRQRKDPYFELTRMQTFDLLTGYSVELRIKVNRRWEELEALTRIKMPPSLNVYGKEALPYIEWLLLHQYSVTSGQYHRRIKKHPQHFYRTAEGKWYINREFAEALLQLRNGYQQLTKVQGLPQVVQLSLKLYEA